MVRNNRQLTRLFFVLVLGMALFGGWYANRNWRIEIDTVNPVSLPADTNWADFFADLGEEALQLFLGFTSGDE